MFKKVLIYGAVLAGATLALTLLQYKLVIINHSLELYGGVMALIFTVVGIIVAKKLMKPKEVIIEKTITVNAPSHSEFVLDEKNLVELAISKREYEILELMSQGYSNQEIADKTFISLNTVKTHTSNLFLKLDVKRRTQAVMKAKELRLIP